jgi:hypothetical protein
MQIPHFPKLLPMPALSGTTIITEFSLSISAFRPLQVERLTAYNFFLAKSLFSLNENLIPKIKGKIYLLTQILS